MPKHLVSTDDLDSWDYAESMLTNLDDLRTLAERAMRGGLQAARLLGDALLGRTDEQLTIAWVALRVAMPSLISRALLEPGTREAKQAQRVLYRIWLHDPDIVALVPWEAFGWEVPDDRDDMCWSEWERHLEQWTPVRQRIKKIWQEAIARALTV